MEMTRRIFVFVLAFLILENAPVLSVANDQEGTRRAPEVAVETRKAIEGAYDKIKEGFKKNDPSAWEGFLTPDFRLKLFSGEVKDRQWVLGYVRNNSKAFKVLELSMRVKELTIRGSDAIAMVEQKSSRQFKDEQGTKHKLEVGAIQQETWTKSANGWKLREVQEKEVLFLLRDGKPMNQ